MVGNECDWLMCIYVHTYRTGFYILIRAHKSAEGFYQEQKAREVVSQASGQGRGEGARGLRA